MAIRFVAAIVAALCVASVSGEGGWVEMLADEGCRPVALPVISLHLCANGIPCSALLRRIRASRATQATQRVQEGWR